MTKKSDKIAKTAKLRLVWSVSLLVGWLAAFGVASSATAFAGISRGVYTTPTPTRTATPTPTVTPGPIPPSATISVTSNAVNVGDVLTVTVTARNIGLSIFYFYLDSTQVARAYYNNSNNAITNNHPTFSVLAVSANGNQATLVLKATQAGNANVHAGISGEVQGPGGSWVWGSTATTKLVLTANPPDVPGWQTWTFYATGTLVTYQGITYKCIQGHTTQPGWEPPNVPALWQLL